MRNLTQYGRNVNGISHNSARWFLVVDVYKRQGGTPAIPVGTIYVGYGDKNDVRVVKLTEDVGRDINLAIATNTALKGMLEFLKEHARCV